MKTKCPLPKAFSGTKALSGALVALLALSLTAAAPALAAPFAYVSNSGAGTVSVIDAGSTAVCAVAGQSPPCVVATVTVGSRPGGVAVNPAGTLAYVFNQGDGTVSVIDVATNSVVGAPIVVGTPIPPVMAFGPGGVAASDTRVYVANGGNRTAAVIDVTNSNAVTMIQTTLTLTAVEPKLNGVAVVGSRAYFSDIEGHVIVIDGNNTQIATIIVGTEFSSRPMGIVGSPTRSRVYVVDLNIPPSGFVNLEVSAINTVSNAVEGTETVMIAEDTMASPGGIAISPDESRLYVPNDSLDQVTVVGLASTAVCLNATQSPPCIVKHVPVGAGPFGVATDPSLTGRLVYVGNVFDPNVSVIDTASSAACLTLGQTAPCVVANVPVGLGSFVFGAFVTAGPPSVPQYELTLTTVGAGSITARPEPVDGKYAAGRVVDLTAMAAPGSQFSGWSGACSGSGTCSVIMDAAKGVTATFTVTPPPPPVPAPTMCDDKIKDLQKKVAGYKHPWRHDHQLKLALRMYSEALVELGKAEAKVGARDKRLVRAQKELNDGKAALCAGRYWRADREFWKAFEIARSILKHYRYHHR